METKQTNLESKIKGAKPDLRKRIVIGAFAALLSLFAVYKGYDALDDAMNTYRKRQTEEYIDWCENEVLQERHPYELYGGLIPPKSQREEWYNRSEYNETTKKCIDQMTDAMNLTHNGHQWEESTNLEVFKEVYNRESERIEHIKQTTPLHHSPPSAYSK